MKKHEKESSWIVTSSDVPNLGEFCDTDAFERQIARHIHAILPNINTKDLSRGLKFHIHFIFADFVAIGRQTKACASERQHEISIAVAIPDKTQVHYGISRPAHEKSGHSRPNDEKCMYLLSPAFRHYGDLDTYILASACKVINLGLAQGIACNGKKIKFRTLLNLREKHDHLPTIMNYEDQVRIMRDLIAIGATRLAMEGYEITEIFEHLIDSHQDNGVFEFDEKDRPTFIAFIELGREIGRKMPELHGWMENGVEDTFGAFGFSFSKDEGSQGA